MTKLLEIKDVLVKFYSKNETYVKPVIRFFGCLILYLVINLNIGYNDKVSSIPVTLVLSLIGCLLPVGATTFMACVVVILNLLSLSAEVAMIGAVIFILVLVLYYRFSSKSGAMALVTPVLLKFNIPYVVPVATGLVRKPYSIIPAICGTIVYFFLHGVKLSATALSSDKVIEGEETVKYTVSVNQLVANREMYLFIALFILTTVVVYFIRKSNADHAWTIATVAGILIQLIGFFVGFLMFDSVDKIVGLILGNVVALAIGFVIQFFCMNLDYARTERVQFEDDDYYYYVKAVPKKMVASKEVSVKRFGTTSVMAKSVKSSNTAKSKDVDIPEFDFEEINIFDEFDE